MREKIIGILAAAFLTAAFQAASATTPVTVVPAASETRIIPTPQPASTTPASAPSPAPAPNPTPTPAPAPAPTTCQTSSRAWRSYPMQPQSAPFTTVFAVTPAAAGMNGVAGCSLGPATGFSSLDAAVRFNVAGYVDVRNGSHYGAAYAQPYVAGQTYQIRMVVDPVGRAYSVYITPPGGLERLLAYDYAFRAGHGAASSLDHWALFSDRGSEQVCASPPSPAAAAPAASATLSDIAATSAAAAGEAAASTALVTIVPNSTQTRIVPTPAAASAPPTSTPPTTSTTTPPTTSTPPPTTSTPPSTTSSAYNQAILNDHPIMFLAMDTPSKGTQADLSGSGNNGTYVGGTPPLASLPNGDQAADFNGSSEYVTVPAAAALSVPTSQSLTIESWIRPDTLQFPNSEEQQYVYWLGKGNATQGYEYANRMYSLTNSADRPNRISDYDWNVSGGLGSGAYFQDTLTAGAWIMVDDVISMTTGDISIYKNGVLRETVPLSQYSVTPGVTQAPFNIGTRDYNSWFEGAIGKVAVYNYALSAAQISAHYAAMSATN